MIETPPIDWSRVRPGFTETDPLKLAEALEAVRRRICAYGPHARTCDCKYGLKVGDDKRFSEQTGCPELRSVIDCLLSIGGDPREDDCR